MDALHRAFWSDIEVKYRLQRVRPRDMRAATTTTGDSDTDRRSDSYAGRIRQYLRRDPIRNPAPIAAMNES